MGDGRPRRPRGSGDRVPAADGDRVRVAAIAQGGTNLNLDRYVERESALHRADARLKLIVAIGFIFSVSLLPVGAFASLGVAWVSVLAMSAYGRIGPRRLIRGSFVALPFVLAALPLLFTKGGEAIGSLDLGLFTLKISEEGLRIVATIMLKSWISVQAATLLIFTTRFHDLVHGMERLRLPKLMVAVISLMYRYLAVLLGEASRMMRARQARSAFVPGGKRPSTVWRAKVVGNMVGALFIRSYERSERIYTAMQSRGYSGQFVHHTVRPMFRGEWLALAVLGCALVAFEISSHTWIPTV